MKCKLEGCDREAKIRGYCQKDYSHLRYSGAITVRRNTSHGAGEEFIRKALASDSKACIEWPFGLDKDGYGQAKCGDMKGRAHRIVCAMAHGEPPTPEHHAAHACNNPPCCNPSHLSWKTITENMHDKWRAGTMYAGATHHKAKLTEAQVLAIVADPRGSTTVGREYGISKHAVQAIRNGDSWAALTGIKRKAA